MFDIDKAIDVWRRDLRKSESLEDGYVAELESHLRDAIEQRVRDGAEPEAAFRQAVQRLGKVGLIAADYYKTDGRSSVEASARQSGGTLPALLWNGWKVTLRKTVRHKGTALINVAGLALGIASCILILLWVHDETSFDRFHDNADRIYRVIAEDHAGGRVTVSGESPSLIGPTLVAEFPEVSGYTRVQAGWKNWYLHYGEKDFTEERLAAVDPSFFQVFHFPFVKGDPATALRDRYSIVITEGLARRCFGAKDPIGKVLKMNVTDLIVTGVIKDIPENSVLQFDYAFPIINMTEWRESQLDSWTYSQFTTFVELREGVDARAFSSKIRGLVRRHHRESSVVLWLQPLTDIHLRSGEIESWTLEGVAAGSMTYVYIFSLTALCILLVACANFMNLATARSGLSGKEVVVRKVAGASRTDIVRQFLGEALFFAFAATAVGVVLVELFLPAFNELARKSLTLDLASPPWMLAGLIAVAVLTGLVAGAYPAFFLSAFRPVRVLADRGRLGPSSGGRLRKLLVVGQFTFAIVLIAFTTVVLLQLRYVQTKDLGFDAQNVIFFPPYAELGENYEAVRNELLANPNVVNVCLAFPPTMGYNARTDIAWDGKDPRSEVTFSAMEGDYDFAETLGMHVMAGRFYSREFSSDPSNYVISETAERLIGPGSAIGKRLTVGERTGSVIGVVKDIHTASLHEPILPEVISFSTDCFMCVKFRGRAEDMVRFLEAKWKSAVGERPFRHEFLDEKLSLRYESERRIGTIFLYFTGLAILVACLGLFGLAAFNSERRTKEIGIRKVLGARSARLAAVLSAEFAAWVVIASVIATPVAYFLATRWLGAFAYRIPLGWGIFAFSNALALAIAILTVGYHALRTARANPVESLRYE